MMREIVLDTETTGLDPAQGHRIIEIGCVELVNHLPTGRTWQRYLNPERDVPPEVVAVHGLSAAFLANKPVFSEVFAEFLDFIEHDSRLVIHNASFDMKFLNAELKAVGHPGLSAKRVVDTLALAREKFPGAPSSLDALCKRFSVDNTGRSFHGALLDSLLLAEVYLALMGGRQTGLALGDTPGNAPGGSLFGARTPARERTFRAPRPHAASAAEITAHTALLERLTDPVWKKI
jgi:DNA polymerase-3 subunit epsilon